MPPSSARLFKALTRGTPEDVLRAASTSDMSLKDQNELTPLLRAVDRGELDILKALKAAAEEQRDENSRGADNLAVEARDAEGRTALLRAVGVSADAELLDFLVHELKADIRAKDTAKGFGVYHCAAQSGHTGVLDRFDMPLDEFANDGRTPLLIAMEAGREDFAIKLIEKGALNVPSKLNRTTPMHVAVRENLFNVLSLLIDQSPERNPREAEDANGETALDLALRLERTHIAKRMAAAGWVQSQQDTDNTLAAIQASERALDEQSRMEENRHAEAKQEKALRKRKKQDETREKTEVTQFLREHGASEAAVYLLYSKHYEFLDDAFRQLNAASLKKMGLSDEDRDSVLNGLEAMSRQEDEELQRALREAAQLKEKNQKQRRRIAFAAVLVVFLLLTLGLLVIDRISRWRGGKRRS